MSNNSRITNKLTNGKNSYFVTNNESSELKKDIEKKLLIDIETTPPNKDPIADILDKLENLQRFFIQRTFGRKSENKKRYA